MPINSTPRKVVTVASYSYGDSLGNTYQDQMRFARPEALTKAQAAKLIREYVKGAKVLTVTVQN